MVSLRLTQATKMVSEVPFRDNQSWGSSLVTGILPSNTHQSDVCTVPEQPFESRTASVDVPLRDDALAVVELGLDLRDASKLDFQITLHARALVARATSDARCASARSHCFRTYRSKTWSREGPSLSHRCAATFTDK